MRGRGQSPPAPVHAAPEQAPSPSPSGVAPPLDETRCDHVGSRLDEVDPHDNQGDGLAPLAHQRVTRVSVRGPGRFPVGVRLDRRAEAEPPWEAVVATLGPDLPILRDQQARHRLQQPGDPGRLQAPACRARPEPCRTTIARAIAWVKEAIRPNVPRGVVVCAAGDLAEDVVPVVA